MRSTVSCTVSMAGETASTTQYREQDGMAGVTPSANHAVAGVLTTRSGDTSGVITTTDTDIVTSDHAVICWLDAAGALKHRYDVYGQVRLLFR